MLSAAQGPRLLPYRVPSSKCGSSGERLSNPRVFSQDDPQGPRIPRAPGKMQPSREPWRERAGLVRHSFLTGEDRGNSAGRLRPSPLFSTWMVTAFHSAPRCPGTECSRPLKFLAFPCLDREEAQGSFQRRRSSSTPRRGGRARGGRNPVRG